MNLNSKLQCVFLVSLFAASIILIQTGLVEAQNSAAPTTEWQTTFGQGPWGTEERSEAHSLIQTADGSYVLAGGYLGKVQIAKISASGSLMWNRSYMDGDAVGVVQTQNGYAVTCNVPYSDFGQAIAVMAVDNSGNLLWNQTILSRDHYTNMAATVLVKAPDNGYVVGGYISKDDQTWGEADFLLIKTDAEGNCQWTKTYGGPDYDQAASLIATTDGGYALAGYTGSYGTYDVSYWLVITDGAGNLQWAKAYGAQATGYKTRTAINEGLSNGAGDSHANNLIQTSDGGYALFGTQVQKGNFPWLLKTDVNGIEEWNQTYDGGVDYWQFGYSVAQTGDGGYALAASQRTNNVNGEYQTWLIKTDSVGKTKWTKNYPMYDSDNYANYPIETQVVPCTILQTRDNGLAVLSTVTGATGKTAYFTLIKTVPFLPAALPAATNHGAVPQQPTHLSFPSITIAADGTVNPSSAPITRSGNTYTLTADFAGTITVNSDNIILDGGGHLMRGNGSITEADGTETFIQLTQTAIDIKGVNRVEVKNFKFYGFLYQVTIEGACSQITVDNNTFAGPFGGGIYCWNERVSNSIFKNNNFLFLEHAITLNSSGCTLKDNTFEHTGGIYLYGGSGNSVIHNNCKDCQIEIRPDGSNNLIAANTITNTPDAISYTSNVTVSYNTITRCVTAFAELEHCTVFDNIVQDTQIIFRDSSNNIIYQNNFVNYTKAVQGYQYRTVYPMGNNTWSKEGQGNYWSNYTGTDTNNDGVGDYPYVLDGNNIDNYPRMSRVDIIIPQITDNGSGLYSDTSSGPVFTYLIAVAVIAIVAIVIVVAIRRKRQHRES